MLGSPLSTRPCCWIARIGPDTHAQECSSFVCEMCGGGGGGKRQEDVMYVLDSINLVLDFCPMLKLCVNVPSISKSKRSEYRKIQIAAIAD